MKRKNTVSLDWNQELAYIIGLITADGCLSKDGRHLEFNSKDEELIKIFVRLLGLKNRITKKGRGGSKEKKYYRVQFGDTNFYDFLLSIGLMPNKSLVLKSILIPEPLFRDFIRGLLDGDGSVTFFSHPESKKPQLRVKFASASFEFLNWLCGKILNFFDIKGKIYNIRKNYYELTYFKKNSIKFLKEIYYSPIVPCLSRKRKLGESFLTRV